MPHLERRAYALALALLGACAADPGRFPARAPLWRDADEQPFRAACRTGEDGERVCMPEPYRSSLVWDAADNTLFRPLARSFAVAAGGESVNVNSLDEVPDSSWFQNRLGAGTLSRSQLLAGACDAEPRIPHDRDGAWLIDRGKTDGATPGFRVRLPDGRKLMIKVDVAAVAERASAASVIVSRLYHAIGFNTPCERVWYIRPSLLRLKPGLTSTDNTGITRRFDRAALETMIRAAPWRGGRFRVAASEWLPDPTLGPFRYEGVRDDDPNDVVAHEDRRELRGGRLLAAWVNHFDSREQNTMTTWVAAAGGGPAAAGFIRHYYLDFSDSFGSEWQWDGISRRLGHSYYFDFQHVLEDFVSFGLIERPWDRARRTPGAELFGYFSTRDFDPESWQPGYPNPAYQRMTERDGAWMARILARFTRDDLRALIGLADLSVPAHAAWLESLLYERLRRILARYLTRLSPLADVAIDRDRLCATDLAGRTGLRQPTAASYRALVRDDLSGAAGTIRALPLVESTPDHLCLDLRTDGALPAAATPGPAYHVIDLHTGGETGPLRAHLYDRGDRRGYLLAGLERPEPE